MQFEYINKLPNDTIREFALTLSLTDIYNICVSNKKFNDTICNDNYLWKRIFIRDFGIEPSNIISWKKLYEYYGLYYTSNFMIIGQNIKVGEFNYISNKFKEVSIGLDHADICLIYMD